MSQLDRSVASAYRDPSGVEGEFLARGIEGLCGKSTMTALASDNGNTGSGCCPGAEHQHSALEEQGVSYILLVEDLQSTASVGE